VTQFFLAGSESDSEEGIEAAYSELRERSHDAVGCAPRKRRIFRLDCRFEGSDCEIEVGRPLPHPLVCLIDDKDELLIIFRVGIGMNWNRREDSGLSIDTWQAAP